MKGSSRVIMGATLVMVVSLAMVLGLVLVLLADLYCSLLLRRRRGLRLPTSSTTTATAAANGSSPDHPQLPLEQSPITTTLPLRSFYAQGVLHAPRHFLFPHVSHKEPISDIEKQQSHQLGVVTPSPPSPSFLAQPIRKVSVPGGGGCSNDGEHLMYISNLIYDNDSMARNDDDTPFETPDTSPSRLGLGGSSGDDEEDPSSAASSSSSIPITPPLSPMKKLPEEACSICLRDARSLATSGSDSNSNHCISSSSSGSPCTSPSW